MLHFLGFLFILFIAILIIGLSLIGSIVRGIFGFGRKNPSSQDFRDYTFYGNNRRSSRTPTDTGYASSARNASSPKTTESTWITRR